MLRVRATLLIPVTPAEAIYVAGKWWQQTSRARIVQCVGFACVLALILL